jgi:hypothetical protein
MRRLSQQEDVANDRHNDHDAANYKWPNIFGTDYIAHYGATPEEEGKNQDPDDDGRPWAKPTSCRLGETTAKPVNVMVKVSAGIHTEGVTKRELLEVIWKDGGRWHLGPIDKDRNDSDVA